MGFSTSISTLDSRSGRIFNIIDIQNESKNSTEKDIHTREKRIKDIHIKEKKRKIHSLQGKEKKTFISKKREQKDIHIREKRTKRHPHERKKNKKAFTSKKRQRKDIHIRHVFPIGQNSQPDVSQYMERKKQYANCQIGLALFGSDGRTR